MLKVYKWPLIRSRSVLLMLDRNIKASSISNEQSKIERVQRDFPSAKLETIMPGLGKNCINNKSIRKSQNAANPVSGRVTVPRWHVTPVPNVQRKPRDSPKVNFGVKFIKMMRIHCNWSNFRMSFDIFESDTSHWLIRPRIDHNTSWMTISRVPWCVPVWVAYWKVVWLSE